MLYVNVNKYLSGGLLSIVATIVPSYCFISPSSYYKATPSVICTAILYIDEAMMVRRSVA